MPRNYERRNTMNRQPVSSSRMRSVGWENNTLEIQFHDDAIYQLQRDS